MVAKETKSPDKKIALRELHEVALRMESMFLNRANCHGRAANRRHITVHVF